jgi:RNA polymerase sigma-70 factor, ECF subfamily
MSGARRTAFTSEDEAASRFEREALPHLPRLYPAALRMTDDPHDAGELVQETFARASREYPHRRPGTDPRTWLYRILVGLCRATRLGRPAGRSGSGGPTGVPVEPDDLERLSGGTVVRALHELPVDDRIAVYLADVEGFGHDDIATITETPLETVVRHLTEGRRRLRDLLERSARTVGVTGRG